MYSVESSGEKKRKKSRLNVLIISLTFNQTCLSLEKFIILYKHWLITSKYCMPCFCHHHDVMLEFPCQIWAEFYKWSTVVHSTPPYCWFYPRAGQWPKILETSIFADIYTTKLDTMSDSLLNSKCYPPDLFLKTFPWLGIDAREQNFEIRFFIQLDILPSQANEFHLPILS